jgi:hypothetical protein
MGYNESGSKRKVHSTKCLHTEIREFPYCNLKAYLKSLKKKKKEKRVNNNNDNNNNYNRRRIKQPNPIGIDTRK